MNKFSLILLSGGQGSRMKEKIPKQYLPLLGKPVIVYTLETVDEIDEIEEVIICAHKDYHKLIKQYINDFNLNEKKYHLVDSGESRSHSMHNGLIAATNEKVIIHESARPFVNKDTFMKLITDKSDNVIYGTRIPFTVLKGNDFVISALNREELINVQLPQKFSRNILVNSANKMKEMNLQFTEEASMIKYFYSETSIKILEGTEYNIKLTYPFDIKIGEVILKDILNREDF